MPGGGGPPTKWGIAHPWTYGLVFGALVSVAFAVVSAMHGEFSAKTIAIAAGAGILAFLVASLIAASYRGDISKGW